MKMKPSPFLRAVVCVLATQLSARIAVADSERQTPPPSVPTSSPQESTIDREPLSLAEFRAAVNEGKALVLDVRDDAFFARGHVPGALSLPHRRFKVRYAQLQSRLQAAPARPIIVYCDNTYCDASTAVQARLQELGYTNVAVFPDGWAAWKTAGYPEEKSEAVSVPLAPWKNPS